MSLYQVQKFLYQMNRDPRFQLSYEADRYAAMSTFDLTDEEREALAGPDIGLLFHFGVNGQILMHFAAYHGIEWSNYLQLMRDGISTHGPVREGVYAMTGYEGVDAHAESDGRGHGHGMVGLEESR
jgi:Aromatic-ring-opening dioxygenase LigAB, LigA subunit